MDTGNYDAETVRFFDVAHEGAQIRLVAGEVERWGEALSGLNPRSLVIIPTDAIARQADLGAFVRHIKKAHGFGVIITGIHVAQA